MGVSARLLAEESVEGPSPGNGLGGRVERTVGGSVGLFLGGRPRPRFGRGGALAGAGVDWDPGALWKLPLSGSAEAARCERLNPLSTLALAEVDALCSVVSLARLHKHKRDALSSL